MVPSQYLFTLLDEQSAQERIQNRLDLLVQVLNQEDLALGNASGKRQCMTSHLNVGTRPINGSHFSIVSR